MAQSSPLPHRLPHLQMAPRSRVQGQQRASRLAGCTGSGAEVCPLLRRGSHSRNGSGRKCRFHERVSFRNKYTLYAGTIDLAGTWPGTAYVYHFSGRSPWDGPNNKATHILHVAFVFPNYNQCLSDAQRATAEAFVWPFITFVNGKGSA